MYSISVEGGFRAVHHVRLPNGELEAPHPHDWKVSVVLARPQLDELAMVADFGKVEDALTEIMLPLSHADLNRLDVFAGVNPTAEIVARFIFDSLAEKGLTHLRRVEVTEAPGCRASYEPA